MNWFCKNSQNQNTTKKFGHRATLQLKAGQLKAGGSASVKMK